MATDKFNNRGKTNALHGVRNAVNTGNRLLEQQLGLVGSIYNGGTETVTCALEGKNFVAITFVTDSVFNSTSGLVATDDAMYINTQSGATDIDSDGDVVDSVTFPAGMTIYGKWTQFILASGSVIAYIG